MKKFLYSVILIFFSSAVSFYSYAQSESFDLNEEVVAISELKNWTLLSLEVST